MWPPHSVQAQLGGSLVSLAVPEASFIQNPITTRQHWSPTFHHKPQMGNGSSGHFKEQGLLGFLAELEMYGYNENAFK